MKLSIVLVNYRGWKRLRPCLESLSCLEDSSYQWEVIIVDNHSGDGQLSKFVSDFPKYRFIENSGNFGFAHGCNVGANQTTGEYIFFLNPDTIINLEAVYQLRETIEKNPDITILTCQQVNDVGKNTRPYGLFLRPSTLTGVLRAIYRLIHTPPQRHTLKSGVTAIFPEWVSGSAMLMRREKFNSLGGWCEDYWMYFEDADLCKRIKYAGGKVALLTDVHIIHNHGGASRINPGIKALTKCEVQISMHVYISKHFTGTKRVLMQVYLILNNLFFGPLILAVIGLLLSFVASMRVYPKMYYNTISYYMGVLRSKTWLSPRSVNYRRSSP